LFFFKLIDRKKSPKRGYFEVLTQEQRVDGDETSFGTQKQMHVAVVLMVKTQVAEHLVYFETYRVTEFLQESICRDVHCVLKLLGSMNLCSDSVHAICPCFDGGWSLSTYALDLYAASML
jgi:hypothetical protein